MPRRAAVLTFMLVGPMIWLPALLAWAAISGYDPRGQLWAALPPSLAIGGVVWCLEAVFPRGWLYTWIPTLGAALLFSELVRRLPLARVPCASARMGSMAVCFALAASSSAIIFSLCMPVATLLGLPAPLLPAAQTQLVSFGVRDPSLSRETLICVVALIGGVMGAVLGALWPAAAAPAASAMPRVALPPSALRSSPSLYQIVGIFFVVGPLLYMPLILVLLPHATDALARPPGQVLSVPLLAPVGAIIWYGAFFFPPAWLQTWIPTLGAAVLFWAVLARSRIRRWASYRGALSVVSAYAISCGALSVSVFALCQSLDGLLTHRATVRPNDDGFMGLMQSAPGHTMLVAVAIMGVTIGVAAQDFGVAQIAGER
jgi:hypothetical protein